MSRALVDAGARVAITSRAAERAGHAAADLGPGALGIALDARDEDAVAAGVAEVWERLGGIDLLVNNAGIGMRTVNPRFLSDPRPFWEVPPDGFRDVFETKVTGCFLMARAVVPLMLEQGGGRIVTISMNEATMVRQGFAIRPVRGGGRGAVAGDGGRPGRQPGDGQPAAPRRRHRHRDGPRRHAR
jgi:NAD(P)-dependent dehydrogenase (short-subunit alcohol dehydrogenase family)